MCVDVCGCIHNMVCLSRSEMSFPGYHFSTSALLVTRSPYCFIEVFVCFCFVLFSVCARLVGLGVSGDFLLLASLLPVAMLRSCTVTLCTWLSHGTWDFKLRSSQSSPVSTFMWEPSLPPDPLSLQCWYNTLLGQRQSWRQAGRVAISMWAGSLGPVVSNGYCSRNGLEVAQDHRPAGKTLLYSKWSRAYSWILHLSRSQRK